MSARGLLSRVPVEGGISTWSSLPKRGVSQSTCLLWNRDFPCRDVWSLNSIPLKHLRRTWRIDAARKNVSGRRYQQPKSRITDAPKKLGRVGGSTMKRSRQQPETDFGTDIKLNKDQAIGQVITAQANFMRVIVQRAGNEENDDLLHELTGLRKLEDKIVDKEEVKAGENGSLHINNDKEVQLEIFTNAPATTPKKELELLCVVRNVLKKIGRRVLVGDRVLISGIDWTDGRGMIEEVIDRQSEILDPPVANVNQLLVVFSISQPQIDEKVLSRFLVEAESTDIPFSLVLNKIDLVEREVIHYWQNRLADWGYHPVLCSADHRIGLSSLTNRLKNKITVILGPSGVGKSSLINALRNQKGLTMWNHSENELQSERQPSIFDISESGIEQILDESFEELRVGEVSVVSGRGRHTTRHVSLLHVPGGRGRLADTPGFSQPSLTKVTSPELAYFFPEIGRKIAESENGGCGFPNCLHSGEPFCAVGQDWDRFQHYIALLEEVQNREKVEKRVLGTKRESEVRYKVRAEGVKQAEPRLALKKHRRESRKHVKQSVEEDFRQEEVLQAEMEETANMEYIGE